MRQLWLFFIYIFNKKYLLTLFFICLALINNASVFDYLVSDSSMSVEYD